MTWQVDIEIHNSRSPSIKDIIQIGQRTATNAKIDGNDVFFSYDEKRAQDCDAMFDKIAGWKSATVFLNGHLVRAREFWIALDCLLYGRPDYARHDNICRLCPASGKCEKATKEKLNKIVSDQEQAANQARIDFMLRKLAEDGPPPPE